MKLDAQWITGFVDGEGCFRVGISTHKEATLGFQVLAEFTVVQHKRDVQVLHALKDYFECGVVRNDRDDRMVYRVRGHQDLQQHIVPFFIAHSLKTKKNVDFIKFRHVVSKMSAGEHLTAEGLEEIRAIAEQMDRTSSR